MNWLTCWHASINSMTSILRYVLIRCRIWHCPHILKSRIGVGKGVHGATQSSTSKFTSEAVRRHLSLIFFLGLRRAHGLPNLGLLLGFSVTQDRSQLHVNCLPVHTSSLVNYRFRVHLGFLWCKSLKHHQFCIAEIGRPNLALFLIPLVKVVLLVIQTKLSDRFLIGSKLGELQIQGQHGFRHWTLNYQIKKYMPNQQSKVHQTFVLQILRLYYTGASHTFLH